MPLDVVLVSPYPAPNRRYGTSGVASYTANLARHLAAQGASVAVIAPDTPGAPPMHSDGRVLVMRSGSRGPHALGRAVRTATKLRPQVIHLQHEMFLFGGATSLATLPFAMRRMRSFEGVAVTTVHQVVGGGIGPELMKLHRMHGPPGAARMVIDRYNRLMASGDRTIVHEPGFIPKFPNGVHIPHGVEKAPVPDRNLARRRLGIESERRLVVLCFGFVAPYKGLEHVLAEAAAVPEVLLVVAGGNHPRHGPAYTETLNRRWGTTARFTGWVPDQDVASWHAAADLAVFCYPAPHSSSGAVADALGYGMPVLASEALADTMRLPREMKVSTDPGVLAGRLRRLAADRELLADLRQCSARVAVGRLWPDVANQHLLVYEEASQATSVVTTERGQLESV